VGDQQRKAGGQSEAAGGGSLRFVFRISNTAARQRDSAAVGVSRFF